MGLTVSRKTAKNSAVRRKNEKNLTVSLKKIEAQNKVLRSFVESDVLCAYMFWERELRSKSKVSKVSA